MISVQLVPFSTDNSSVKMPAASEHGGDIVVFATLRRVNHEMVVDFLLRGDTSTIQWPVPLPHSAPGNELWKHTCFEVFIADSDDSAYWEYNFSPSRQWAIYAFSGYRQPSGIAVSSNPSVGIPCLGDKTFTLQLQFPLEAPLENKSLSVGVSAVVENRDGTRQYFALTHCAQKPDFHRRDSFLIKMK